VTVVVCDASPLIILAKLDRLDLIGGVLGDDIVVLRCVADEVLGERAGTIERQRLAEFLSTSARVAEFSESDISSTTLSESDQFTLTYSMRNSVDWLVADEKLMRRVASKQGIAVMGVLGLIVAATNRHLITHKEAESLLREAVSDHGLRISVALHQRVLDELR
jgi:predicted nucleic acid-binding protein